MLILAGHGHLHRHHDFGANTTLGIGANNATGTGAVTVNSGATIQAANAGGFSIANAFGPGVTFSGSHTSLWRAMVPVRSRSASPSTIIPRFHHQHRDDDGCGNICLGLEHNRQQRQRIFLGRRRHQPGRHGAIQDGSTGNVTSGTAGICCSPLPEVVLTSRSIPRRTTGTAMVRRRRS